MSKVRNFKENKFSVKLEAKDLVGRDRNVVGMIGRKRVFKNGFRALKADPSGRKAKHRRSDAQADA